MMHGAVRGREIQEITSDKDGMLRAPGRAVSIRWPERKEPASAAKSKKASPGLGIK